MARQRSTSRRSGALRGRIAAGDVYQANLCRVLSAPLPTGARPAGLGRRSGPRQPGPVRGGRPRCPTRASRWCRRRRSSSCARDGDVVESSPDQGHRAHGGRPARQGRRRERDDRRPGAQRPRTGLRARASSTCPPCCAVEEHPGLVHLVSTVARPAAARRRLGGPARRRVPARVGDRARPSPAALRLIDELETGAAGPVLRRGRLGGRRRDGRAELAVGIRTFWADAGAAAASAPGRASPGARTPPASGTRPSSRPTLLGGARVGALGRGRDCGRWPGEDVGGRPGGRGRGRVRVARIDHGLHRRRRRLRDPARWSTACRSR